MISFINRISEQWFSFIADSSIQLIFFFLIIFALAFLFRNRSAKFLFGLWTLVLLKAMIPPSVPLPFEKQLDLMPHFALPVYAVTAPGPAVMLPPPLLEPVGYLFLLWLGTMIFLAGFVVFKNIVFRKKLQHALLFDTSRLPRSIKERLQNCYPVKIVRLKNSCAPFSIGLFHPKIYLPPEALQWDEKKLEAILMHEIAHIQRKDLWFNFIQNFLQIFYFFHPVIWLTNFQLKNHCERACDDYAILHLNGYSLEYSKFLLSHLDQSLRIRECPALVHYFFTNKNNLMKRFEYLMKRKEDVMLRFRTVEKIVIALLVFTAFGFTLINSGIKDTLSAPVNYFDQFGKITGKVIDAKTGDAIPGANVVINGTTLGAVTDMMGEFVVDKVPPGLYQFRVSMVGYEPGIRGDIAVKANLSTTIDFVLKAQSASAPAKIKQNEGKRIFINAKPSIYGIVLGKVTSEKNGEPISGAEVHIPGTSMSAFTNVSGAYSITNVPPGKYWLQVDYDGYKTVRTQNVRVQSNYKTEINFRISADNFWINSHMPEAISADQKGTAVITGRVTDKATGKGIAGANVVISGTNLGSATDPQGSFTIKHAPPGMFYLRVTRLGYDERSAFVMIQTVESEITKYNIGIELERSVVGSQTVKSKKIVIEPYPLYDFPPQPKSDLKKIEDELNRKTAKKRYQNSGGLAYCFIDKKGRVKKTEIKDFFGDKNFQEPLLAALKKAAWKPALKNGEPVETWISIPFSYTAGLKDGHPVRLSSNPAPPPPPPKSRNRLFVPYDVPPTPVNGFAAIQKNLHYPEIAQRAGIEGVVIVQIQVGTGGNVVDYRIARSLGENNGCDEAAIAAIKKTKWKPALQKKRPVKVWVSIPVRFNLTEKSGQMKKKVISPSPPGEGPVFVPYDHPPEPIGGFAAIQKNLRYPEIAKKAAIQGTVIIQVLIDTTGQVVKTKVAKSLGNNGCDEAAIASIKRAKWKPALQRDKPVKVWVNIPVIFRLKEQVAGLAQIMGTVTDKDGNPVKDAVVLIQGTDIKHFTKGDGKYTLLNVSPGKYKLIIGIPDYEAMKKMAIKMERNRQNLKMELESAKNPAEREKLKSEFKQFAQKMRELEMKRQKTFAVSLKPNETLEMNIVLK